MNDLRERYNRHEHGYENANENDTSGKCMYNHGMAQLQERDWVGMGLAFQFRFRFLGFLAYRMGLGIFGVIFPFQKPHDES
jgi:hypothetical protein